MEGQTTRFGATIDYAEVEEVEDLDKPVKVIKTYEKEYTGKSIIIATGGSHNKLGVTGEDEYFGQRCFLLRPFATAISSETRMWWL